MKKTTVINLFGGSGIGKSTTAAQIFSELKVLDRDVELVREYVKNWAWQGRKPTAYDQLYIIGQQTRAESLLYHKVDLIVTDSPFLLAPFYEKYYTGEEICLPSALRFYDLAKRNGVEYRNFVLTRHKEFNPQGRFETKKQAEEIDKLIPAYLTKNGIEYIVTGNHPVQEIHARLHNWPLS